MAAELLLCLSRDLLKLFEASNDCDVSVRVGKESNVETFNVHSSILTARSPYFAAVISEYKNEGGKIKLKKPDIISEHTNEVGKIRLTKPDITPRVFKIILKYLYSGEIVLERYGIQVLLEILIAADGLCLEQLIEYIQTYIIENKAKFLHQKSFPLVHQTAFRFKSFKKLQEHCTKLIASDPKLVAKSNFISLEASGLRSLIERDDLAMDEIDIWNSLIKWGIAQIESLPPPEAIRDWSDEDFLELRSKLQDFIPLVRFYHISSIDFYNSVKPFHRILPEDLYEDLLQHYLVPESHDRDAKDLPRRSSSGVSSILSRKQLSEINKWISNDPRETFNGDHKKKYKLLLRGSRNGFTSKDFHQLCDNKGATLTIIKVKETGRIIGGYNPLDWSSNGGYKTDRRGFLFSCEAKKEDRIRSFLLSCGVKNEEDPVRSKHSGEHTTYNDSPYGPTFGYGHDLQMRDNFQSRQSCYSKKCTYEHAIMKGAGSGKVYFSVEDYEVFQVEND